jgi:O-antigen/teichoic acid export membrane protein
VTPPLNFGKKVSLFLIPSIVQGLLGFAMVPITTYVLEPQDFGLFALVSTMTALPSAIASMGSGYLIATHYPVADLPDRRAMISTFLLLGLLILLVFILVVVTVGPTLMMHADATMTLQTSVIALSCLAMLFAYPWGIAIDVITLEGNAHCFAIVGIAQSLSSSMAIVVSLYVLNLGALSLFVGLLAGSICQFAGALATLHPYMDWAIELKWGSQIVSVGIPAATATMLENVQIFFERFLLAAHSGAAQLGLYYHSQQYRSIISLPIKAIARSVWPRTLLEAKHPYRRFADTKKAWDVAYVGITFAGVILATIGKPLIAWWTYDKFGDAYWIAAVWMVFILIQNSGKPQTGVLYAFGDAAYFSRISALSSMLTIGVIVVAATVYGLVGVVFAVILQQVLFRVLIQVRARTLCKAPFQDQWVISGSSLILFLLGTSAYFDLQTRGRLLLFIFVAMMIAVAAGRILNEAMCNGLKWFRVAGHVAN